MTAYLNQNYYGNDSYGVAAAAQTYFGKSLKDLTLAQAAIIAAIPQAPSTYDLVRNAEDQCTELEADGETCAENSPTELVVPPDSKVVQRRNLVLDLMAQGRTPLTAGEYTAADFEAAKQEPVVLAKQAQARWRAPHFVWQVRDELTRRLCGEDAQTCPKIERGRLQRRHDARLAGPAAWRSGGSRRRRSSRRPSLPRRRLKPRGAACVCRAGCEISRTRSSAMARSSPRDYQTGEPDRVCRLGRLHATSSKRMQPQFDVARKGYRQPGSAFKPIMVFDRHRRQAVRGRVDVHGRRHGLRRGLHPDGRRPARAGPGAPPRRAPVLTQHPGLSRPSPSAGPERAASLPGVRPPLRVRAVRRRTGRRPWVSRRSIRSTWWARTARLRTAASGSPRRPPRGSATRTAGPSSKPVRSREDGPEGHLCPQAAYVVLRHPGRQHRPDDQPVLGQVRADLERMGSTGRPRSRPVPTTTPRTSTPMATSPRPQRRDEERRVRIGRRRLERQFRQLARVDRGRAAVLDRRLHVRLAGLP